MAAIRTDGCLTCGFGYDNPAHLSFAVLVADSPLRIGGEGAQFRPLPRRSASSLGEPCMEGSGIRRSSGPGQTFNTSMGNG